ncbi:MAG: hypothetical protein GTO42_02265 [Candidatus Latescibacteria bacterium]|nr:hypothetical protein [Candidatus Latescibacterota bacterium]NIO00960.1 hypothetical protein [Candidatus Latescibacterota bacterium]NIO27359.1 hypothetical protein [Candidatus Latescibacterota bacterium]NIO54881.1 hypothetical protein [Candidatus Latescibacterota bacterium]NIT00970.1 hypothetical protein [Candidatus Latescibacterota bacterium]
MAVPIRYKILTLTLSILGLTAWPLVPSAAGQNNKDDKSSTSDGGSIPPFAPNTNLTFSIPKILRTVKIDGKLDEPIWKRAARLDNFVEISPGDNERPKVKTEAFFAYDTENFYLGFICYDHDTNQIRASICDRDEIFDDDFVGIILDTFNDQQNGYEFFVNPHGIQGDLSRTPSVEDESFDTIWEAAGEINSVGWTAEMAIPFRSLRFPDAEEQEWRIHVLRIRPRDSREQISWAPISRDDNCLFCQAGTMKGIVGVNKGRNLEFLPYAIGTQASSLEDARDPDSRFVDGKVKGDWGLGVKYGITSNLTADLTYNPDFSQVESDAAQIDVNTTFALFFPEKRPFFLEGYDIFRTHYNVVYTRTINDPTVAAKLTGKMGKYTIGYVLARDEISPFIVPFDDWTELAAGGKSISNILRIKRDILSDSYIGILFTDRHHTNGSSASNTTFGVDWTIRFKENYYIDTQIGGSYTREPDDLDLSSSFTDTTFSDGKYTSIFDGENFTGTSLYAQFRRNARHWNVFLAYQDLSPTLRAENGFVTGNNYRLGTLWNGFLLQPNNKVVDLIEPAFNAGLKYNHEGIYKDSWFRLQNFIRFKKQTSLFLAYLWSAERFRDVLIKGISRLEGEAYTEFSEFLSGGSSWRIGRSVARSETPTVLGRERTISLWTTVKPTSQLRIHINYDYAKMLALHSNTEFYSGFVARSRLTYQFTKRLYLRLITQYNDFAKAFEIDPLLSYKINPFTVFFMGSTHDLSDFGRDVGYRQTDRQFFVKFQYLFRV